MHTVLGSLASTLGVLAAAGILLSILIRIAGYWTVALPSGRRTNAEKAVLSARELIARKAGDPADAKTKPADMPAAMTKQRRAGEGPRPRQTFGVELLEQFSRQARLWLSSPWIVRAAAVTFATAFSIVIGTQFLYVPMVSNAYRELYRTYCTTDGISEVLSRRVAERNIAAIAETDACVFPAAEVKSLSLTEDDVFFLLDALGLRDAREKTRAELFAKTGTVTKNHALANWLMDPQVYTVGTPTSRLLLRIASKFSAGYAAGVTCESGKGKVEATQIGIHTALLSAVLAQQPVLSAPTRTLGAALLGPTGPVPLNNALRSGTEFCDGNKILASNALGANFGNTGFLWDTPLLEKPTQGLTGAQTISLVLGWTKWQPATATKSVIEQDAAVAFMEAVASEANATPEVRDARIAVNFFIGWERLAILCIVVFLGLCLLWQQMVVSDDARHLREIRQVVSDTASEKSLRLISLRILAKLLYRNVGRSAPREILVAALEVNEQVTSNTTSVDFDRVRRVADHEMRIIDRSRFFFLAGLPLLPTIGFVGTVRSLIEALALADRIPRARTMIEQVAAVSDVTSTLSLCFSTTFMALGALLIFAPLDLWQATSERRIVEETERLLDPGL